MSASTWITRARDRIEFHRPSEQAFGAASRAWIGIDFSSDYAPRRARKLLPLLVVALIAALGVSALRIDLIRVRYAMASVLAEENALIEEQRNLIVRRRQLRDPVELAVLARARGFRPLSVAFSLPDPVIASPATSPDALASPSVSAGPPADHTRSDWR